jgi:hypothetical protein
MGLIPEQGSALPLSEDLATPDGAQRLNEWGHGEEVPPTEVTNRARHSRDCRRALSRTQEWATSCCSGPDRRFRPARFSRTGTMSSGASFAGRFTRCDTSYIPIPWAGYGDKSESTCSGGISAASHCRSVSLQDHRHAVLHLADEGIGLRGDERERLHGLPVVISILLIPANANGSPEVSTTR